MNEPRKMSFLGTIKAVLWAFVGIRKNSDHQHDMRTLDPKAVIIAGLLGGLIFVLSIVGFVNFVVLG